MDNTDKLKRLRSLDESELRRSVVIPLLGRMGFAAATEYHGAREHGKDIVCFDTDRLGERRYLAIVAKTGDLTGSASSASGMSETLNQVEQCFNEKYMDLFGMRSVTMDHVWVVTTGKITTGAGDGVAGRLEKSNLAKLVRFISCEQLVTVIDEHFSAYWDLANETIESVRAQRDRMRQFILRLLGTLGATKAQAEDVATQLLSSPWIPDPVNYKDWTLRHASPYSVAVAKSESAYPKGLWSDQCGDIVEALRDAQEKVRAAFYDVEETLETGQRAIAQCDPREFLALFEEIEDEHPFHRAYGRASDAVQAVGYLQDGVNDVDQFLAVLETSGQREYYLALVSSLESSLPTVEEYLKHVDVPEFLLNWEYGLPTAARVDLLYDRAPSSDRAFQTEHKKEVPRSWQSGAANRPVEPREVIRVAQGKLREKFENQKGS